MKRYISLALAAVILVFSLAVPSYAVESPWINLLDYCSPNDSGSNLVDINSDTEVTFDYKGTIGYVDFTVMFYRVFDATAQIKSNSITRNLTAIQLDDYTWRFYGALDIRSDVGFRVVFPGAPTTKVQFLNFRLTATVLVTYDTIASGYVSYGGGEEVSFYYNSYDDYGTAVLSGSSDLNYEDYAAYISFSDWKKYDYIDIRLFATQLEIDSLSASLGDVSIPVEHSFFNTGGAMDNILVNVFIDLTLCDRDSEFDLELVLNGDVPPIDNRYASLTIISCCGFLEYAGLSESVTFWYRLRSFLTDKFSSLSDSISDLGTEIGTFFTDLRYDLGSHFGALGSEIGAYFDALSNNISAFITSQTVSIATQFANWFNSLDTWITNQTTSITNTIATWGQKIVDVIVGDSSENEDLNNAVNTQEEVNSQVNTQLGIAVDDWDSNFGTVSTGFNTAFTSATPSLLWLSSKAQNVFVNMGWFGNMFFFIGFINVFFLLMAKSGLSKIIVSNGDD